MFTLDFFTDNSAFEDNRGAEIARVLRQLADVVESEGDDFKHIILFDANGNDIGKANFEPDDD